ncbi:MAG: hypothetical protein K2P94_11025 [Rhodospirillaceae bacterium]|nr:hypothetical protein [Rhodospirillaceae bacterium]
MSKGKKPESPKIPPLQIDGAADKRAARNVEKLRNTLSSAMDDPHMREQIVRAMRQLINEDKS